MGVDSPITKIRKSHLRFILGLVLVIGSCWFFAGEFRKNISDIQQYRLDFNFPVLVLALFFYVAAMLIAAGCLHLIYNQANPSLRFFETAVIVNLSSLTKYLPGKLWSYAVQIDWLKSRKISGAFTLFANIAFDICSLSAQAILAILALYAMFGSDIGQIYIVTFLIIGTGYLSFIVWNTFFSRLLGKLLQLILSRPIEILVINGRTLAKVQFLIALFITSLVMVSYLTAIGIGLDPTFSDVAALGAAMLLANVIGYVVLIAPGGLGVRESVMYLVLANLSNKQLALILPIATRVVMMVGDLILGLWALKAVRRTKSV